MCIRDRSLTACAGTINNSTADTASNVTFTFTDSGVTAAGETDTGYEIDGTALKMCIRDRVKVVAQFECRGLDGADGADKVLEDLTRRVGLNLVCLLYTSRCV